MLRLVLALLVLVTSVLPAPAWGRRGGGQPLAAPGFQTQGSESCKPFGVLVVAEPKYVGQIVNMFAEINEQRRLAGRPPFKPCPGLQAAAEACVAYRAKIGAQGHVNDGAFVPPGYSMACAGAACWPQGNGLGGCNRIAGNETYCGAASCMGSDGRIYHHLYYR